MTGGVGCKACGHLGDVHDSYRTGSDCSARLPHIAIDGVSWSLPCRCTGYQRPDLLARIIGAFR